MSIIIDLYKQLFGRKGIADGNVIDMAEHGRAGGVSTGQGFKFVDEVNYKTIINEVDSSTTYVGKALIGTATSEAKWQIKKIITSGTNTQITYAEGSDNFSYVWDNRTSYTYS